MRNTLLFIFTLTLASTGNILAADGENHNHEAHGETDHSAHGKSDHAAHGDAGHDHSTMTPWIGTAPTLALELTPDIGRNVNLHILADGFTFTPEQVNGPVTKGTGHAHVYVNDVQVARAYSAWMHIKDVPTGAVVRVTLNANDHSAWAVDGEMLVAEITAQ